MKCQKHEAKPLLEEPNLFSLAELYHENSKLRWTNSRQYREFISAVVDVPYLVEKMAHGYKSYSAAYRIELPRKCADSTQSPGIEAVIERRRSARQFTGRSLTVHEISKLLQFSYGITCVSPIAKLPDEDQC